MAEYGKEKLQEVLDYLIDNPDMWNQGVPSTREGEAACFIASALRITGGKKTNDSSSIEFSKRFGVSYDTSEYVFKATRTLPEIASVLGLSMTNNIFDVSSDEVFEVEYLDKVKRGLTSAQARDMSQKLEDLDIEFKVFQITRVEVEY